MRMSLIASFCSGDSEFQFSLSNDLTYEEYDWPKYLAVFSILSIWKVNGPGNETGFFWYEFIDLPLIKRVGCWYELLSYTCI